MPPAHSNWIAAAKLGLVSSTFSTIVSQLAAAQLGRDAAVDWMTVAAIPLRDGIIGAEPSWGAIIGGIAFHQWADFSWALVFFGLFGRWTADLRPLAILAVALPWAVFTSASEWFVLVPLFPFFQPIFTLQQPYWIGLLVHASSAVMYPLFVWLRFPFATAPHTSDVNVARAWAVGGVAIVAVLGSVAALGTLGHQLPWMGTDRAGDQDYMRHMSAHHRQGITLARLGADRAQDPELKALARLMVASQEGENRIFDAWWQSWFDTAMPACSTQELGEMPGYLSDAQLDEISNAKPDQFDATFVRLMSLHHAGAVRMADREWQGRGDMRLRIMAHAIRHQQQGEIALMNKVSGLDAVRQAVPNMFADNVNRADAGTR
ncbi:conserved membrane protein of unknown function [Bradyrhizobium sp. ORS 285]|uniref:DUF305 domain-containing protein n=1 Tax=Bradyrhizobium sp. ORS 285 TaxID=115808 RepID=UPI0002405BD3|nr:DUF305 domain-containing protein [Bradyrhizobium sp. ORS 285]CCD85410.1 conserved membrane hypothetical protein [Bradyrhizobium sp. ORS 285]SMX60001.1 conserved membrane protein of unknown function [Bradyrhizobium sp. ORS 285]